MIIVMKKIQGFGADGLPRTTFIQDVPMGPNVFKCIVDQVGIKFQGNMMGELTKMSDLQAFAEFVSDAWKEHVRLKNKKHAAPNQSPEPTSHSDQDDGTDTEKPSIN